MHKCVKKISVKNKAPLSMIKIDTDKCAQDNVSQREAWQGHFATLQHAKSTSFKELLVRDLQRCKEKVYGENAWAEQCTVQQVATIFSSAGTGRSEGEDGIPPDFFARLPEVAARLFHPVYLKCETWKTEPCRWRGGLLHELYKGKRGATQSQSRTEESSSLRSAESCTTR